MIIVYNNRQINYAELYEVHMSLPVLNSLR